VDLAGPTLKLAKAGLVALSVSHRIESGANSFLLVLRVSFEGVRGVRGFRLWRICA
jgi:hypothetical protein